MVGTSSPDRKKAKTEAGGGKWALKPHRTIEPPTKVSPLLVVVLDGWGACLSCAPLTGYMWPMAPAMASWRHWP